MSKIFSIMILSLIFIWVQSAKSEEIQITDFCNKSAWDGDFYLKFKIKNENTGMFESEYNKYELGFTNRNDCESEGSQLMLTKSKTLENVLSSCSTKLHIGMAVSKNLTYYYSAINCIKIDSEKK